MTVQEYLNRRQQMDARLSALEARFSQGFSPSLTATQQAQINLKASETAKATAQATVKGMLRRMNGQ